MHGIMILEGVILTAAIKALRFANIWKGALAPFAPSNYVPALRINSWNTYMEIDKNCKTQQLFKI